MVELIDDGLDVLIGVNGEVGLLRKKYCRNSPLLFSLLDALPGAVGGRRRRPWRLAAAVKSACRVISTPRSQVRDRRRIGAAAGMPW